jgi:tetraacyldisaccharide 4'-kinase
MIQNPVLRFLLWPLTALYAQVVRVRVALYRCRILKSVRVTRKVISIGNLTVGGTGKTPLTVLLTELMREQGQSVAVLSKGYKRRAGNSVELVSDGTKILLDADRSGDEAQWLARKLKNSPVVVGSPKWRAARWIEDHLPVQWIVVDDGFQHLKLWRDRNILLLDAARPFDNGRVIPLGRLREPPEGIRRADIVVCVGSPNTPPGSISSDKLKELSPSSEWFSAYRECLGVSTLEDENIGPIGQIIAKKLLAFCGLGQPEQFFEDLGRQDLTIVDTLTFPDHHRYGRRNVREILMRAGARGAEALITTSKDAMNLPPRAFGNWPCFIYEMKMTIDDEPRFLRALLNPIRAG